MKYAFHLTVDELKELFEKSFQINIEPIEKRLDVIARKEAEEFIKIEEVCAKLQVTSRTVRNWVRSKKIRCYYIGGRQFFKMEDIIEKMKSNF